MGLWGLILGMGLAKDRLAEACDTILHYGLPVFYFFLAISFYLKTYDSCQIKINITHVAGALLGAAWLIRILQTGKNPFPPKSGHLLWPVACIYVWGYVSFLLSPAKGFGSWDEFTRRLCYISFFAIIVTHFHSEKHQKRLLGWFLAGALLSCLYGLVQFMDGLPRSFTALLEQFHFPQSVVGYLDKNLPRYPQGSPGWDPFIWRQAFGQRVFSTFGNPNFFANYILVVGYMTLGLYLFTRRFFHLFLYLLVGFCVIFTYTKAAYIGFAAGVVAFGLLAVSFLTHLKKGEGVPVSETTLKTIAAIAWAGAALSLFGHRLGLPRSETFFGIAAALFMLFWLGYSLKHKDLLRFLSWFAVLALFLCAWGVILLLQARVDSVRFRVFTWLSTWEMLARSPEPGSYLYDRSPLKWKSPVRRALHPFIGSGVGSFKAVYPAYRRPQIFHIEKRHNTETDHAENEFIEVWYDEGGIGFGFFLLLLFSLGYSGIQTLRRLASEDPARAPPQNRYRLFMLVGLLAALVAMMVDESMDVALRFVSSGAVEWFLFAMIVLQVTAQPISAAAPKRMKEAEQAPAGWRAYALPMQVAVVAMSLWLCMRSRGQFWADVNHNIAIFFSKQGNWVPAIASYNKVLQDNPDYVMSHYFMGNVYNDRQQPGDQELALQKYQDVLSLAPNYVQMHYQIGVVYQKMAEQARQAGNQGKFIESHEKAIESFLKYRRLDPVFFRNYQALGMSYASLGRWQESAQTFKDLILEGGQVFESKNEAWLNLGNIYYMESKSYLEAKKNIREASRYVHAAETSYRKALEISGGRFAQAWENLIVLYFQRNRLDKALWACQEALKIDPNNQKAKAYLLDIIRRYKEPPAQKTK